MLIGGIGSPYVYRRVAEWGDGWIPVVADMAAFREGMDKLKAACDGVGRDIDTLDITVCGAPGQWRTREDIAELEKNGANRVTIWITAFETQESLIEMEALAKELL